MSNSKPFYTVVEFAGHLDEQQIRDAVKRFLPQEIEDKIAVLSLYSLSKLAKELADHGCKLASSGLLSQKPGAFTEKVACELVKKSGASYVVLDSKGSASLEGLIPMYRSVVTDDSEAILIFTPQKISFQNADPSVEELKEFRKTLPETSKCLLELPFDTVNAPDLALQAGFQGIFFRIITLPVEKSFA